jgi:hypothetical protein
MWELHVISLMVYDLKPCNITKMEKKNIDCHQTIFAYKI